MGERDVNEQGLAETEDERAIEFGNALVLLAEFNVKLVQAGGTCESGDPRIEMCSHIAQALSGVEELLHSTLAFTEQQGASIPYADVNARVDALNATILNVPPIQP